MKQDLAPPTYVIIDLGSSSFHLQAVQMLPACPRALFRIKRKVYLAAGLDEKNQLSPEFIEKGLQCIRFFADQLRAFNPDHVAVVGTAALRVAVNRASFITPAQKLLNQNIRVLSGEEEALLIYRGVGTTSLLASKHLVIDIGGASTEMIYGEKKQAVAQVSIPIGAVMLNTQFFPNLQIHPDAYAQAVAHVKDLLSEHAPLFKAHKWQQCLAASGIFRSIWEILTHEQILPSLTLEQITKLRDKVLLYASMQDINLPGMRSSRHSTLVSGLAILEALMSVFHIEFIEPAQGALREGVLSEMTQQPEAIDFQSVLEGLSIQFQLDQQQSQLASSYAYRVFNTLRSTTHWRLDNQWHDVKILVWLWEIGLVFGERDPALHTAYFFKNRSIAGIDEKMRMRLVVLFQLLAKQKCCDDLEQYPGTWLWISRVAGIVIAATRLRRAESFPELQWQLHDDQLVLHFDTKWAEKHPWGFVCLEHEVIRQQRFGFDTQLLPILH